MKFSDSLMSNQKDNPWIVQKYGGTSLLNVGDSCDFRKHLEDYRVVLVCSARSCETKSKGTTNMLLRAAEESQKSDSDEYLRIVDQIAADHVQGARSVINNAKILKELEQQLYKDISELKNLLNATKIINEISPHSKDKIIGYGERLSCRIVHAVLRDKGIDAEFVSLENVIGQGKFDRVDLDRTFYDHLADVMSSKVRKCGDRVPVVTGNFGVFPGSLLANVGRGYTDLCAALLASGLGAKELQIWKEVDGIFTADPRKVKSARLLTTITPEEASELTYYGSEVIHPFTMEQVMRRSIPIRIKNVMNPLGEGTIVFPDNSVENGWAKSSNIPDINQNGNHFDTSKKQPTAVTIKDNVIVINVHSNRKMISHGFFAQIFAALDTYGIIVDLISTSEVHVSMALGANIEERDLQAAIQELKKLGQVDVLKDMAILSLVGKQMKNAVGIAGKMFTTLAAAKVNIEMISQGASEINISCVIDEVNAEIALNVIHANLLPPYNI
ncbi:13112_t:CDS:2 [Acaulospora morrowiae]|uniref:Aspartokinase n=1 Tax=Acaulospora morrowiae TaxID=94023 RepID=A0A9N9C035_9GLOM|nr:13112_t:CDS:2 [Acaulospora morrowiae]